MWEDNRVFHWRKCYYGLWTLSLWIFSITKWWLKLIDQLESCGLLVDYGDAFISCLDCDVMLHFFKFVPIYIYILNNLSKFSANFWVNYSFKHWKAALYITHKQNNKWIRYISLYQFKKGKRKNRLLMQKHYSCYQLQLLCYSLLERCTF